MDTRPPPGAPPPYARVITQVYRRSLRPVILFTSGISLVWALVVAVRYIRDLGNSNVTAKTKTFSLVLGILFFALAGIEIFGFTAGITQRLLLARTYYFLSGIAVVVTFGAVLVRLIAHFILKSDLINVCVNDITGDPTETISGTVTALSSSDARSLCSDNWNHGIYYDVGWLIVSTIMALIFASLAAAYYHQLLDPSFSRTTTNAPSNAFRMGAYNPSYSHQGPYHQDPPFVPPYPGGPAPPTGNAGYSFGGATEHPPEYGGGGSYGQEEKKGVGLGRNAEGKSESTVMLQPPASSDEPARLAPGEGRV